MSDISRLYPPTPAAVPPDLTTPTRSYRTRVVIVLLCLIVFAGAYLTLTVGSAYASYYCFSSLGEDEPRPAYSSQQLVYDRRTGRYVSAPSRPREEKPVFWLVVGGIGSAFLFLFLVKGLFKSSRRDHGPRVEVTEHDQPVLFAFIRQLCKDTGAPFPHRVFLTPDVNAAVSFQESLLNLVFPSRKNLIIGLGLVNRLNLTEFKAVLAHEFGHFSQNSMKLGSYVYTANRVVADVVYGRDAFDDMLGNACRTDIRIAIFAWGFYAILWTMRKGLDLMFRGINFAHASLSRQMEYNADLVAVSVCGSDAIVFSLARLDFAGESLGQAWNDLTAAADHGRFTRDLYYHHTKAAEFLKVRRNDPNLGEVPPLPDDPKKTVEVFKPEDTSVPKMWATHPSNHDRERNVKARYVRGPIDERSAWEIFADRDVVSEAVTRRVYEVARKVRPEKLEDPEAIQAFIDAEHAETTYSPRYQGLYENRYIKPGDLDELCTPAAIEEFDDREKLAAAHARLCGDELKERMDAHKARQEEVAKLSALAQGAVALTGKDFEYRGRRHGLAAAPRLLKEVEGELEKDYEWMHSQDREVFRVHRAMAVQLGGETAGELDRWYRFHLATQGMHSLLAAHMRHVQTTLSALGNRRQVSQDEFQAALAAVRGAHEALREQLDFARGLLLPPLRNMTAGDPLGPFLLSEPLLRSLHGSENTIDGAYVGKLMAQMGEVLDKGARILFKSLGGLLAMQEQIAERWALPPAKPEPTPDAPAEPAPEAPAQSGE
jgi:Zn-dependent protease with chaperone function